MGNSLHKIEQNLRSITKRYKTVKYSIGLAILFLMLGINAFSEEVNGTEFVEQSKTIRSGMKSSIEDMRSKIESVRAENNKGMGNLKLELIQLTEQGDQVVKSPWNSWQFGANYFYNNWRETYEGKGDKKEKYPFEGVFTRSSDLFLRNIHPDSKNYEKYTSYVPSVTYSLFSFDGVNPQKSFAEATKPVKANSTLATTSLRGGDGDSYGIANTKIRQEDIAKIELGVTVKPKDLNKTIITQNVTKPEVPTLHEPGSPAEPNANLNIGTFSPIIPNLYNPKDIRSSYVNTRVLSYHSRVNEGVSYWNTNTNQYEAGKNGAKNNGKSYNHNTDVTINGSDLSGTPAFMYTSDKYYTEQYNKATTEYEIIKEYNENYDQALFKIWFDYGSITKKYTAAENDAGGKTLTIANGANVTIDSINNAPNKGNETDINKQRFLVGGSRVGTLDNAVNATIKNQGVVNLLGPLTLGFESQTDTDGLENIGGNKYAPTTPKRPGSSNYLIGKREIINDKGGVISDDIEASDRTPNLGGLKVSKIDQDGNIVEAANDTQVLQLGKVGYDYDGQGTITVKRTPDIVDKNNHSRILKRGGYTGYKIGMILTTEDSNEGDYNDNNTVQSLINRGTIKFNGGNSIGIQVYAPNYANYKGHGNAVINIVNEKTGVIELRGDSSVGMKLSSQVKKIVKFENEGKINIGGSYSSGISVARDQKMLDNRIAASPESPDGMIGKVKNTGEININSGEGSSAMDLRTSSDDVLTNSGTVNIKGNKNIGLRVEQDGQIHGHHAEGDYFPGEAPKVTNIKDINIKGGIGNIGMLSYGTSSAINLGAGKINLQGKKSIGMYAVSLYGHEGYEDPNSPYGSGNIVNYGEIVTKNNDVNVKNENIIGMAIMEKTSGVNTGKINLTGKEVIGVYNMGVATHTPVHQSTRIDDTESSFKMLKNGSSLPEINVSGKNSIGVYSRGRKSKTLIEVGKISSEGGIGLFADRGVIHLGKTGQSSLTTENSPTLEARKNGVMFYNYSHTKYDFNYELGEYGEVSLTTPVAKGNFVLNNSVNGTVKNGGTAFYLRGNDVNNKVTFLNKMFTDTADSEGKVSASGKKVNLRMEEGSTLFVTHNYNINNVTTAQKLSGLAVNSSNNYGNRVTIDSSSSNKYKIEKSLRNKLEIDTDVNLDDRTTTYNRMEYLASWVTLDSGKKMTSSKNDKVAIFQANVKREQGSTLPAAKAEDVKVINKGKIALTGKNSVAMGASFGQVTNEKDISVTGEAGIGIYGADSSVIKNIGTVEVGKNGTGIYAENDLKIAGDSTAISTNKNINITNTGTIKAKTGSTGVYGIYAKNDKTNYKTATATVKHSGVIDLAKNKSSIGIYTENGNLTSNGNVSVGGNGIAIKTVKSTTALSSGNINATSGIGVLAEDSTVNTNANMTISNGLAMSIKNSKITVGGGTYNLTKSIGFKIGTLGVTDYFKGNAGTLNLGENSIAYQLKDTNLTSNSNFVDNLGINSTGKYTYIYADNSTLNYENQKILNSDGSIFAYAKNSNITLKTNTNISSNNKKITGIFSENTVSGKNIVNNGTINLLGKESLGIYSEGSVNLVNTGKVTVGEKGAGIYSKDSSVNNSGEITTGNDSTGIYAKSVNLNANSKLSVGNNSVGIYSVGGNINLANGSQLNVGADNSTGLYYNGNNGNIINNTDKITVGDNSNVFTIRGQNNKVESNNTGTINLRNNSMYMYSTDSSGSIINKTNITSTGNDNYGIYSAGKVDNYANIDFSNSVGSIAMYSYYPKSDSYALSTMSLTNIPAVTNHLGSKINVSRSNLSNSSNERYGIGMAAGHTEIRGNTIIQRAAGYIVNYGTISVASPNSIGMYATGRGSIAENRGRIELSGNKRNIGMYLENGAEGYNYGTITTTGNSNNGQIGVVVTTGATLYNSGTININSTGGIGIYNFGGGIVYNTGNFVINAETRIKTLDQADTSKGLGGVNIQVRKDDKSQADIFVNGKKVEPTLVHSIPNRKPSDIPTSSIGIYMSSSGINPTRPIENLGALASSGIRSADLIIGTEAAEYENSKYIQLGQDIIEPYNKMIKKALRKGINKYEIYSGSLTWQATVTQNKADQTIQNAYMTKIPYTVYAGDKNTTRDTYNFTDGLEQRYGVEAVGSREKELFNKLNSIGNNEGILLKQAFDEMMGHQYANIHQRVQSTGDILDKEFTHLKRDWATASKKSHKVKTFATNGEYKTNTAGVINTTNNAYGVAYVYENEDIKLGKGFGYYTGLVHNTYKFKDIGRSKEEMLEAKIGAFKSIPFDNNNSFNWTISGDISYGYNKMHRKFLVVDEVFSARGRYNTYGIAIKNELGKEFRLTETLSLRPYGAIKVEYMKVGKVKEKSGEVKLDVNNSHYTSIKPELGVEANFKYTMLSGKIITARLGTAFEDELGKVAKTNNKAKVANTSADWFNLPKEKEDRKGNIKTDFSIGLEGEILGGTANIGYDTKGNNIRGGLGVRIIF